MSESESHYQLIENGGEKWRRGWDSDSGAVLKARKLLILGSALVATTADIAPVGYTLGTVLCFFALLLLILAITPTAQTKQPDEDLSQRRCV